VADTPDVTARSPRLPVIRSLIGVVAFIVTARLLLGLAARSTMPFRERHGLSAILACVFFVAITLIAAGVGAAVGRKLNRVVCVLAATVAGTMATLLYVHLLGTVCGLIVGLMAAAGVGRQFLVGCLWTFAAVTAGTIAGITGFAIHDSPVHPLIIPSVIVTALFAVSAGLLVVLLVRKQGIVPPNLQQRLCGGIVLLVPFTFGIWVALSLDTIWRVRTMDSAWRPVFDLQITPAGVHWLCDGIFDVNEAQLHVEASEAGILRQRRFRNLRLFGAYGKNLTARGLQYVSDLPSLQFLYLETPPVSDADLKPLGQLRGLRQVRLTFTAVTGEGLSHLPPTLSRLWLDGSPITDEGLRHLQHMTVLVSLSLNETQISDTGLEHLHSLPMLSMLSLRDTRIGDSGLETLSNLSSIERLDLSQTRITDAGLGRLRNLPSLHYLSLAGTHLTNDVVGHLKAIGTLKYLDLEGTALGEEALDELRAALPMTQVYGPDRHEER
jgi:hypothetical protein